jgi:hypothetical protein
MSAIASQLIAIGDRDGEKWQKKPSSAGSPADDFLLRSRILTPSFSILCSLASKGQKFVKTQVTFLFSPSLPNFIRPSSFFPLLYTVHGWAHSTPSDSRLSFFCIVETSCIALSVQPSIFLQDTNGRYQR